MKYLKPALSVVMPLILSICKGYPQTTLHKSIVSTKMVVLSYKHNDSSPLEDHTDTLKIPVVSDNYPELKDALSFEHIGDEDGLQAEIKNYADCSCGITSMDYEVMFERKDILSIKILIETMGAYPSSNTERFTLNIHTGKPYYLDNEIDPAGFKWIYSTYKKLLKKRIAEGYQLRKGEEDKSDFQELNESIDSLSAPELFKNYLFTTKGIILSTDSVLPHVVQSLEPDREWFIPYSRLRKYRGPHARVVK